jgi:hypothetical protein
MQVHYFWGPETFRRLQCASKFYMYSLATVSVVQEYHVTDLKNFSIGENIGTDLIANFGSFQKSCNSTETISTAFLVSTSHHVFFCYQTSSPSNFTLPILNKKNDHCLMNEQTC